MVHKVIIPKGREVNLSIIVPQNYVGEEIEIIAFIKKGSSKHLETLSPALKGNPLTNKDFIQWIESAEAAATVPIETSRKKWLKKRSQLEKLIR